MVASGLWGAVGGLEKSALRDEYVPARETRSRRLRTSSASN